MIKFGITNTNIVAILTPTEFTMLTGEVPDKIPDNTTFDLTGIQAAIDLRDKNMPVIRELVTAANKLQNKG
jgi:hypothetical protein